MEDRRVLLKEAIGIMMNGINQLEHLPKESQDGFKYQYADPFLYELLHGFAQENKKYPTEAEALLWERIRSCRLGKQFNRQHIIGQYIVDFVCLEIKLVIEVDGGYHSEYTQIEKDENRTEELEKLGFVVLRFKNEDIIHRMDFVIKNIVKYF